MIFLLFSILWPFSVAVTVSPTRKKLEHQYKESKQLISCHQEKRFSFKEHKRLVKKYWMMAETHNPQFVIACSPVSSAFGVFCLFFGSTAFLTFLNTISDNTYMKFGTSDYKWSTEIIFMVQLIGVVAGSIAPIFRCFTSISHYNLSKKWSKNQLNVFRVEKHWIQTLKQWKYNHVHSRIPGRHSKIVIHYAKITILNFCITIHIAVLVICKIICLVPRTLLILLSCSWYFLKLVLKWFKKEANVSTTNENSEIEEYTRYAVQMEEDTKLSDRVLRNTLNSITQLMGDCEKKQRHNLIKLLEKSKGFSGVLKFDNDLVPHLYPEKTHNCWSLVVVTLTSTAIALPNIANGHFKGLLVDILSACFTNIPRVIEMKCHQHVIEKRGDSIRNAAQLLGKSKKILKILKSRKLPNIDLDSMAYIDKWRLQPKSKVLDGCRRIPNVPIKPYYWLQLQNPPKVTTSS
ncbi:hypothetical protein L1987_61288 [Smallanthus sonchifolius]|uniref:Uncharacterized protein n=1 Tax=Smallanthus sonchifolius TaxID=185202 RepID=A0ACB9DAT4_9ASTR|nr:hypothetical protein L1987_61288 [Smallanthus sonchifolius]